MKGQVSLEFLIVLAIFFSMLIVSFSMLVNVKSAGDDNIKTSKLLMTINDFENSINEVCLLGEGSNKIVNTQLETYTLEIESYTLRTTYMGESMLIKPICEMDPDTLTDIKGSISISKQGEIIIIEEI